MFSLARTPEKCRLFLPKQLIHLTACCKGDFEKEGSCGDCKLDELVMCSSWIVNWVALANITPEHNRGSKATSKTKVLILLLYQGTNVYSGTGSQLASTDFYNALTQWLSLSCFTHILSQWRWVLSEIFIATDEFSSIWIAQICHFNLSIGKPRSLKTPRPFSSRSDLTHVYKINFNHHLEKNNETEEDFCQCFVPIAPTRHITNRSPTHKKISVFIRRSILLRL